MGKVKLKSPQLLMTDLARDAGLAVRQREVVVQLAVPSEVLAAERV